MPSPSTIVGGTLFAYAPNRNDFALETNEFAVQFSLAHTSGIHLPLAPQTGTSINCSATLTGRQTLQTGYADFDSEWFVKVWYDGTLDIMAGSVLIPSLPATPIRLLAPFKISGTLTAYKSDPSANPPPPPWFQYKVVGAGNVTVRLTAPIGSIRNVTSYFYQFT
jgi:hypothetical protein